jgi:hypothetical protein
MSIQRIYPKQVVNLSPDKAVLITGGKIQANVLQMWSAWYARALNLW